MAETPLLRRLRDVIATSLGRASVVVSMLLWAVIATCYTVRPDTWAAATVFPIWAWVLPGMALTAIARRQLRRRWWLGLGLMWCILLIVFADHPRSLVRFTSSGNTNRHHARGTDRTVRIVSLNCAGSSQALTEVALVSPDIVLVQESPGRGPLIALARELFGDQGHALPGVDASIIANGTLTAIPVLNEVAGNAVHARVQLAGGGEVDVVSLRLEPALARIDLWSPECWRAQTANRRRRRMQLQAILSGITTPSAATSMIVGGDFNAPPRDAVFELLTSHFHDCFLEAGRGWGNTITNDAPFMRIDQIWVSPQFRAVDVYSRKTIHSDHRMVVCDAVLHRHAPDGT